MTEQKPATHSKINWTQGIAFLAAAATLFGLDLDPEKQAAIVLAIQGFQSSLTVIFRTWFTNTRIAGFLGVDTRD